MDGGVFDIQHFCTGDGPGIRTTVFLKGCSLRCEWCHNPESQAFAPEILLNKSRCIGCGACDAVCPAKDAKGTLESAHSRRELCPPGCRLCADVCPSGCLEVAGKKMSAEAVMAEVLQDETYYKNSEGGMTISGGEPMAQPAFTKQLLEEAKAHSLHTVVETSGNGRKADFLAAAPYVSLWYWDIKLMDAGLYRQYTGGSLDTMLENLEAVYATGSDICFRVLFVPEIHLQPGIAEATAALLKQYPRCSAELVAYHLLGNAKREKLGLGQKRFCEPTSSQTEEFARRTGIIK